MGYDRNDCYMTCGERDDRCAALGIDDPFVEIERLRAALKEAREFIDRFGPSEVEAGTCTQDATIDAALSNEQEPK